MAENNARRRFNLVVEKFAEVFHISSALNRVHYGGIAVDYAVFKVRALYRTDYVGKLAHARRFNKYSVGRVLFIHFFKSLCKIAYERTANTARIKLVNLNSRVL